MPAPAPIRLSKSKFVAGVQCLKRLYFEIHQPELAEEADEEQLTRLEEGHEVGLLAQRRFPGGGLVGFEQGMNAALENTAGLMEDPSVPAIFEATFCHSNVLVRVDVLQRRPGNRWRLIEVKSSVEVKPYHLYDVAIQRHVLDGCGLDISSASLMHLNRDYRYDGKRYDPAQLFTIQDVTRQAKKIDADLAALLKAQWRTLARRTPPDIPPGPQCTDPYQCEFHGYCNPEPPEHHISFLPNLRGKKQEALLDLGVSLIDKIPDDFPLTELQARMRTSVITGRTWVSETLGRELSTLKYPLYFMDFESLNPAIPRFRGMWPYAQIPFQWSVHRQLVPGARLYHFEFLADSDEDPRQEFIELLCNVLGKRGHIVVYNAGFESQRLGELAVWFPEYRRRIENIQERLWDLLPVVKRHVYHPDFRGSFSIKAVLPALVPRMTYDQMEVAEGGQAGLAWDQMIRGECDPAQRERLRSALLAYCQQDTLAMAKILERLRKWVLPPGRCK
jgi:predicted RecB family nuclease